MEENVHRKLTPDRSAAGAAIGTRTLNRRFRQQTGMTPLQWLHGSRIRRTRHLQKARGHPVGRGAIPSGEGPSRRARGHPGRIRLPDNLPRSQRIAGTSMRASGRALRGSLPGLSAG
jgi:methylphosphotriester-DNA--protein-cysteine methyltransferase